MTPVVAGIDIGGTSVVFGLVDRSGNCLADGKIATSDFPEPHDFAAAMTDEIRKLLASRSDLSLTGIGIGAPNGNYYRGTVEYAPNLAWKGIIPLAEMFRERFHLPSALTNDANAAAIGEMLFGGAQGMKDFIVITLGTGVGSGIVSGGELVYGHDGFAGEIGHTIYDPNGRQCNCGRRGCLETYASATGVCRTARELLDRDSQPSELRGLSGSNLTAVAIAEAASRGDKIALEVFETTGQILGLKLADSVAYTSPEAIFLFGGLANSANLIFEPTYRWMEHYMLNIFKGKVKLLPSGLKQGNVAVLGAAALIWNELSKTSENAG
ncbi:MAG: ROK family protein [Calditrichaeota bacterium]|nr:ROK family protein [Calditrichota bacterium]MCB9369023.1 ROK family protein [Calditrichota bacterium]